MFNTRFYRNNSKNTEKGASVCTGGAKNSSSMQIVNFFYYWLKNNLIDGVKIKISIKTSLYENHAFFESSSEKS